MCQIDDEELSGLKARPERERERGMQEAIGWPIGCVMSERGCFSPLADTEYRRCVIFISSADRTPKNDAGTLIHDVNHFIGILYSLSN